MSKKVIHYAFEHMASLKKDSIAVQTESANISYEALNAQANRLADLLSKIPLQKGEIAAAFLSDSIVQLVSLLGIFKAGCIYLPLDKKYNQNHWESLFMDIKPKALIISEDNFDLLNGYDEMFQYTIPQVITATLQDDGAIAFTTYVHNGNTYVNEEIDQELSGENPTIEIDEDDSNYIFFTSGSTGKPKAVLGKHKSLCHFISWVTKEFEITDTDRIGLLASFSFDASLHDIFAALSVGSTLFIPSNETKENIGELQNWIQQQNIGILHMVPTLFRLLTMSVIGNTKENVDFSRLKYVLLAGEKLYRKDVLAWRDRFGDDTEIVNLYGTTETTCLSTINRIGDEMEGDPAEVFGVGQPISNTMILILNSNNQLCRVNEVGSVYIRTPYTTKGYYKDEELTNKKFVQNPLTDKKDIIYKTGDYGRYDEQRNITILGREDGIVKVSGVRVDVNSIEKTILELEPVEMVKCILRQDQDKNYSIACFFKSDVLDIEDIRRHCTQFLSQYEVPSFIIKLDEFPINANGKIDRNALEQHLNNFEMSSGEIMGATNEVEQQLIDIWQGILEVDGVGIGDDFLLRGGNSIRLIKLKVKLHQIFDVSLSINDLFSNSKLQDQANLIINAKAETFESIPNVSAQENYPLSSSQHRLWILSQFEGSSESYNMPSSIKLNINEIGNFERAIEAVIGRHEILRTVFAENEDGEIRQWIRPVEEFDFTIDKVDYRTSKDPEASAENYIQKDSYKSFDLANGPLVRIALLQTTDTDYVFYYNMHHIISDARSMELLAQDVQTYYDALEEGTTPKLAELSIQYKDFAAWQLEKLSGDSFKADQQYWSNYLSGTLPILELPSSKMRPKVFTHQGNRLTTLVDARRTSLLKEYCQEQGGTLFMGILSILNVLFHKYSNQKDIIIGSPIEGRDHIDLANQIGFYINTLVHRNQVDVTRSFNEFFSSVKKNVIASFDHQQYPFDEVLEDLSLIRDVGRNALFDVLLTLQNTGKVSENEELVAGMKEGEVTNKGKALSQMDLAIDFLEVGDRMYFQVIYNSDIYEENMISGLMLHFQELLDSLLSNPNALLGSANYLIESEKEELLHTFNSTEVPFPYEQSFIDLFQKYATETPNKIAVKTANRSLSYEELDMRSNQLANFLQDKYALNKGDFVVINIERDELLLVSILAILKSGCAYIPVDPSYPEDRKQYILDDSNCGNVIDERFISAFNEQIGTISTDFTARVNEPTDLAYVIYTSGSTGHPKGVMIEHQGMMNHLYAMERKLSLNSDSIIVQNAPYTFDISVWQLLNSLMVGGTTSIYDQQTVLNTNVFLERIQNEKITLLQVVPSYLKVLLDTDERLGNKALEELEFLLVTGEAVSKELVNRWFEAFPQVQLVNAYGPAEASDDVTLCFLDKAPNSNIVPIGSPIDNMSLYIMDEQLNLCGKGIIGEICVSGIGLSPGYLNRDELTREKFVTHPFKEGERLYKTGDLGRILENGNIEFVGRKDHQVKVSGHRIELGEIEHLFLANDKIKDVVVIAKKNADEFTELVMYFEGKETLDIQELRTYATTRMPVFMVPSYFVQMDKLPLTPNGKVDRKALPDSEHYDSSGSVAYVAPRNEIEEQMVTIWKEVLKRNEIGINHDFFELGGNSIKTIFIVNEIEKVFGIRLNVTQVFLNSTIEGLSLLISAMQTSTEDVLTTSGQELIL